MKARTTAYIQIYVAVILFSLTAILGDLIQLDAVILVWWRVFITSISLLFFVRFGKDIIALPRAVIFKFIGIGILVALHWICFYGAIKLANASVALVALATTTFFTSLLEPLLNKTKVKPLQLVLSLAIIPGMAFVVSDLNMTMISGLLVGLISALFASSFATLNKKHFDLAGNFEITFLEIFGACLFISVLLPFYAAFAEWQFMPSAKDWIYLMILALACTTAAYYISLCSLKSLSAFESNLVVNLEPVFGILLAVAILNEHKELQPSFYIGVIIIMTVVFSYPFLNKRFNSESLQ